MIKFFNPGAGYLKIKPEIDEAINRVLTAGDLILRKDVEEFEETLAKFVGTKYAVGLNSGTDALYLALKAAGVGPGDEVITSSHTFVATVQVIALTGATPILVDIGENWEDKITHQTKAVIPCHIAGVMSFWEKNTDPDIVVIEDACQALGATQNGQMAGSFGLAGCFSFYPAKILGAYGDAGALVTNDEKVYHYVKEARNHFKTDYSQWGINSRLDNLQAAILNVKMKYLPEVLARRQQIAEMYTLNIRSVIRPILISGRVWQDYILQTERRDDLYEYLKEKGIETMKNEYPMPIVKGPRTVNFESHSLRLPINENITDDEVNEIINAINNF